MQRSWKTLESSDLFQLLNATAWTLMLAVAMQACADNGSAGAIAQDEALKGGIPANAHGRGRPGASVGGASGAVDSDDRDASAGDDCGPDTDIRGQSGSHAKGKGNGKAATDTEDKSAMDANDKSATDTKGKSAMHRKSGADTGQTSTQAKCRGRKQGQGQSGMSDKANSTAPGNGKGAAKAKGASAGSNTDADADDDEPAGDADENEDTDEQA